MSGQISYFRDLKVNWFFVFFGFLTVLFLTVPCVFAQPNKTGDFHICYFSLNNEKEVLEMKKFTKKIKQHTHCSISVQEYLTEGDNPEESFKKMVESGARCDGLVISGHHTGSFGGKRASGSLGIDFLEKLSCDEKYSKWFSRVNALWLQGCRTLGTGEVVIDDDRENSADYHTRRVGEVLNEDHLEQSFADLNIEFSATLDQDNPLSSRYLRVFPGASVFGWTKTAPGEKAGSQYSIPFHIAHISRIINNQDALPSDSPIKGTWTKDSAVQYLNSMLSVLNNKVGAQCKDFAVQAWIDHGRVRDQSTEYGFYNPDLNAFKPLINTQDPVLTKAWFLDCLLKNTKGKDFLKTLDEVLKDPNLIRYTYNSLLERLQNLKEEDQKLYAQTIKKLRSNRALKTFLSKKLTGKSLGILRKIDYLAFYEEVYGEKQKIRSVLVDKALKVFDEVPSNTYDERDYKTTLLESLEKHGYLKNEKGLNLLKKLAEDPALKKIAIEMAGRVGGVKALPLLEQGIKDSRSAVRSMAIFGASDIGVKALPIFEQGIKDSDSWVRNFAAYWAGKLGVKALPILEQGMKDSVASVRSNAIKSAGWFFGASDALHILEQGMKDSDFTVRMETAYSAGRWGVKAIPFLLNKGLRDENIEVRNTTMDSIRDMGITALPMLRKALNNPQNYKIKRHINIMIKYIEQDQQFEENRQ